jgi:hypothetical protein
MVWESATPILTTCMDYKMVVNESKKRTAAPTFMTPFMYLNAIEWVKLGLIGIFGRMGLAL